MTLLLLLTRVETEKDAVDEDGRKAHVIVVSTMMRIIMERMRN
jgi:hypothetical protein